MLPFFLPFLDWIQYTGGVKLTVLTSEIFIQDVVEGLLEVIREGAPNALRPDDGHFSHKLKNPSVEGIRINPGEI